MRRRALLALVCLLLVPAIIVVGVTAAFDTNQLCVDDVGRWYQTTYGFGCSAPEVLLKSNTLYGNGTFQFVIINPASVAISIQRVTITSSAFPASTTMISYPSQVATVNGTVATYAAYTENSFSWGSTNTSLECTGAALVPIASNSVQTESCTFLGAAIHTGDIYGYVILFSDGMPVSASIVAE